MEVTVSRVGREEINAPSILYKYRNVANPLHLSVVTERKVWMAAPSSFEDEKEFRNFKRYDLMTDKEIYEKYMEKSYEHHPNFSRQQRRAHAREMTKHPPFKNPAFLKAQQEETYKEYDRRVGVLSLTAINNSPDLWNYYASDGRGFCVGFDKTILFDYMGGGGEVVYPPNGLPTIYGTDDYKLERWKQVYNKELKWSWEQEYRVELFNINGLTGVLREVTLPPECFKEIIFGWDITDNDRSTIVNGCDAGGLTVSFFQSRLINQLVSIEAYN